MNQGKGDEMMAAADADPVIEDSNLPSMDDDTTTEASDVMGEATAPQGQFMSEPAPSDDEPEETAEYPEMVPAEEEEAPMGANAAAFAARDQGDGYLRLVVSVDDGEMRVVDGSVVDGALVEQPDLTGEMAYEVTLDGRRLAGEAFADLEVSCALAPPDKPELGHHHGALSHFDFVVRIPRGEVTQVDLGEVEIDLVRPHRTDELSAEIMPAPGMTFSQAAASRGVEPPEVVAQLKGVKLDDLPEAASSALRKSLR